MRDTVNLLSVEAITAAQKHRLQHFTSLVECDRKYEENLFLAKLGRKAWTKRYLASYKKYNDAQAKYETYLAQFESALSST